MTPITALTVERSPEKVSGHISAVAKKLVRTLARVIPQCSMISQAVAFNMFLAFFALLLIVLSLMKGSLEGQGGQELAMRLGAIPAAGQLAANIRKAVAPGSEHLVLGDFRLGRNAAGRLTGDQADHQGYRADLWSRRQQFLSREAGSRSTFVLRRKCGVVRGRRGECFRLAIRPMDHSRTGHVSVGSRLLDDPPPNLGDDPTDTCPGFDLSVCGTRGNDLELRPARSRRGDDSVVGPQFILWDLRPQDPIWAYLRWFGSGDRFNGRDGVFCNAHLSWCGLERRGCCIGRRRRSGQKESGMRFSSHYWILMILSV